MIYTITLNPSLDYFVTVEHFELGRTNRAVTEQILPGGKGLNVSVMLKNLGIDSTALGFTAGFAGKEIIRRIEEQGIHNGLTWLEEGNSRINVKIKNVEGTEINGIGPAIPVEELDKLLAHVCQLKSGDFLVLAGSIPASVPNNIYVKLMDAAGKGVEVIVDAAGSLLRQVLPYKPFLIKPNHYELGDLFGVEIKERSEAIPYAKKLQEEGARNVLVSLAGKGAVLVAEDGCIFEMDAPKGQVKNAGGAGDSMVAGFLTGWLEKKSYEFAFRMGVCAGSASAFCEDFAGRADVEALIDKGCNC